MSGAHDKRLQRQLVHERDIRNRERELALRKENYVEAAEAIAAGVGSLMRCNDMSVPHNKVAEHYSAASIAKVHVIAGTDVAKHVTAVTGELGAALLRLLAKRLPLESIQIDINLKNKHYEALGELVDRDLELMRQLSLEGPSGNERWESLKRRVDSQLKRREELATEMAELRQDQNAKHVELVFACTHENKAVLKFITPTLIAIRRELELPIDEAGYQELVDQSMTRQEAALSEFIETISRFNRENESADKR